MVTIVDPAGTPVPVYNRSGVTIVELSLTGSPTVDPIPSPVSGTTVVLVSPPSPDANGIVELPSVAEIGDVVEIYRTGGASQITVSYDAGAGDVLVPPFVSVLPNIDPDKGGIVFRRVSANGWAYVASYS